MRHEKNDLEIKDHFPAFVFFREFGNFSPAKKFLKSLRVVHFD